MQRVIVLLSALCLFASLLGGSVVHAAEVAGTGAATAATAWLHAEGDHDQVPPDSDNPAPHHHTMCSGHDLTAPIKTDRLPMCAANAAAPHPAASVVPYAGPLASPLRPPIA